MLSIYGRPSNEGASTSTTYLYFVIRRNIGDIIRGTILYMDIQIGVYIHYKGNRYQVLGVGKHTETMEDLVVYKSLDEEEKLWVRPLTMFQGTVLIDDVDQPRFKFAGDEL